MIPHQVALSKGPLSFGRLPAALYNVAMFEWILDSRRLPWPAPWEELFDRRAPLWMEVGFGNGEFLLALAALHPDVNVVGVEISGPSLQKGARKVARAGLKNVRLVHGNAPGVLWALCPPKSVARVYVNFPDPWPKAAHHHRRLISDRFLHLMATRTPAGAHLDVATDHEEYAAWMVERLKRSPYFESRLEAPFVTEDAERLRSEQGLRTKYEQIALAEGRTCRYFKWRRNAAPAINTFSIPPELPMPHIIMHSPLSLQELKERFQTVTWVEDGEAVRLIGLFESAAHEMLLIDTYVEEEPISQRVGLTIRRRGDEEILLNVHELGFPRPTPGVHRALHYLARWLEEVHPEMRVLKSNVQV